VTDKKTRFLFKAQYLSVCSNLKLKTEGAQKEREGGRLGETFRVNWIRQWLWFQEKQCCMYGSGREKVNCHSLIYKRYST